MGNNFFESDNIRFTPEGGLAIRVINKTGAPTVKGYVAAAGSVTRGVILSGIDTANGFGIFYEDGIADGAYTWMVISGVADVYFWGSSVIGHLARIGLGADTGEVAGQALSEAYGAAPFATDKHFCEIGHVIEARTGAGLAKVVLHFN